MKQKITLLLFVLVTLSAQAQKKVQLYETDYLTKEFHATRRNLLRDKLPDSSVAVFFAAPEKVRSNDVEYTFKQDPDFYYLTGMLETNSMLLVFKDEKEFDGQMVNEILFIQDKDKYAEKWTGVRMSVDTAKVKLGFKMVKYSSDFPDFKINFGKFGVVMWQDIFSDVEDDEADRGDVASLIKHFKLKLEVVEKKANTDDLKYIMAGLREIKTVEEVILLKKAIKISCDGHKEVMKATEPGMYEYQAAAIVEYMFKKNGSEYPGYPSICGVAENSCILHYTSNKRKMQKGELFLMDAGAEYHGYSADVTRTFPVSGKFSAEQKIIYNIVLEAQLAGIEACLAGNYFRDPHKAAEKVIIQRLIEIGLIKAEKDAIKYFFHGTSHYIGLDVHDAGIMNKLSAWNVITVEPGIYIAAGSDCDPKWWNIGVRIEDDMIVTENGVESMSDMHREFQLVGF